MSRLIKRYENRKLYDTFDRKYVSLEDIANLIRNGEDVQIIDKNSDEDITTQTLTQVIAEEGKKGRNPLSTEMLHDVIRWSNTFIDERIHDVRERIDQFMPESVHKFFGKKTHEDVASLKKRVESLEKLINTLVNEKNSE
jgi:polyhydroxyalkanoate synthesis repressor PhaR